MRRKEERVEHLDTVLVNPSPIPLWLATVIIVMIVLSFGQAIYFQMQRNNDLRSQVEQFHTITDELARRQTEADEDRARLRALVERLLVARTDEQVQRALEEYLRAQREADDRRRREAAAQREARQSLSPQPGSTTSPHPSPTPTRSPRPSPTPTPTPTTIPSPSPMVTCVSVPVLGRICV